MEFKNIMGVTNIAELKARNERLERERAAERNYYRNYKQAVARRIFALGVVLFVVAVIGLAITLFGGCCPTAPASDAEGEQAVDRLVTEVAALRREVARLSDAMVPVQDFCGQMCNAFYRAQRNEGALKFQPYQNAEQ